MAPMRKSAALKLIADFEHAVREHEMSHDYLDKELEGVQRRYDFEHTRILTKLTKE